MGQVDLRGHRKVFGVELEGQGLSHFKFRNEVRGLLITGHQAKYDADNRLIGTEGTIEVGLPNDVHVRIWRRGQTDWQVVPCGENIHADAAHGRGIRDVVESLQTGREPILGARATLQSTELMFATYESARRGGRIDMPATIEGNPFEAMLAKAKV
jgi:hypothetical protein